MYSAYRTDMLNNAATREYEAAEAKLRPAVLFRPRLFIDGNLWCALYGDNIQDGVAGFGTSPESAMADFDFQWRRTR